jgi:hypothetical protein
LSVRRLVLLAPLLTGCLSGEYLSQRTYQEPPPYFQLQPGVADLTACLAALGAPLYVRENGDGAMLAWGWADERRWGLTLSVPIDSQRGSLTYQRADEGFQGLVLLFDGAWTLTSIREGRLADVLPSSQSRAQVVE